MLARVSLLLCCSAHIVRILQILRNLRILGYFCSSVSVFILSAHDAGIRFPFRLHICNRCQSYTSVLGVSVHIAPLSKAQRDHLATIAYITLMCVLFFVGTPTSANVVYSVGRAEVSADFMTCASSVRPDYRTRLQRYYEELVLSNFFRIFFHFFYFFSFSVHFLSGFYPDYRPSRFPFRSIFTAVIHVAIHQQKVTK